MNDGARIFDEAAEDYDQNCRRSVQDLDGFYDAVVDGLPFGWDEGLRVLDLGAGTGLLSMVVAEKFPAAEITLADFSAEMLRVARQRFAGHPGRFEFRVMDYAREPLPCPPGSFDLVVSALSIHHLAPEDRRTTFAKVHAALRSGGRFVNADQTHAQTQEAGHEHHGDHPHHSHEAERHPDSVHAYQIESVSLREQMAWLLEAGFEGVDCYYERDRFAVYGGRKG